MKHKPYLPEETDPEKFLNELYEHYDMAAFERLNDGDGVCWLMYLCCLM